MAMRTRETYLAVVRFSNQSSGSRSQSVKLLPVSVTTWYVYRSAGKRNTVCSMTTSIYFPSPREGLDEGSLAELALDGRDIELHCEPPRPWVASSRALIDVPDDASALIDGLAAYGA